LRILRKQISLFLLKLDTKVFVVVFLADIDDCDPRNDIFSQEGEGSWTEFGYCGQHGTCVDGVNSYSCQCDPGWNGTKCEIGMSRMLGMYL